jgi:hypothetical protein
MLTARDRLKRFLTLADQGPAQRAALAEELVEFLIDWPDECPRDMRKPVMTLLDMTLQEADDFARARLAARLGEIVDLPLGLANRVFHCAPEMVRKIILCRNETAHNPSRPIPVRDPIKLLAAAREADGTGFVLQFAQATHIPHPCAAGILADTSGHSLATLCKGIKLGRGFFSALALLLFKDQTDMASRLSLFEDIPQNAAENITSYWQSLNRQSSRAA